VLAYRHVLVAAPALLERLGTPKSPDDLHRFPCAAWFPDVSSRRIWRLGNQDFEPKPAITTNDYLQLRGCAIAGQVLTELPPFLAADGIANGSLRTLLSQHPLPEQVVNLLYPSHRHPSSLVRAYLDFSQQHATEYLGTSVRREASTRTRR